MVDKVKLGCDRTSLDVIHAHVLELFGESVDTIFSDVSCTRLSARLTLYPPQARRPLLAGSDHTRDPDKGKTPITNYSMVIELSATYQIVEFLIDFVLLVALIFLLLGFLSDGNGRTDN